MTFEVIVFNAHEAIQAEKGGATQLELVRDLELGGLTPSIQVVKEVVNAVEIPVHVMVRTSNVYEHTDAEMKDMLDFIKEVRETDAAGIVWGSLDEDKKINVKQLKEILKEKQQLMLKSLTV